MYTGETHDVNLSVGLEAQSVKKDVVALAKSIVDTFKGADKSIQSTSSSMSKVEKGAKNASSSLSDVGKSTQSTSSTMQNLENRITKATDKLNALKTRQAELGQQKIPTAEYIEIQKQIDAATAKLAKYQETWDKAEETGKPLSGKQLTNFQYEVAQLQNTIEYAKGEMQELVDTGKAFTLGSDTSQYATMGQQIQYAEADLAALNTRHDELASKENKVVSGAERLAMAFKAAKDTGARIIGVFKKIGDAGKNSLNNTNKSISSGIKKLLAYGFGLRSLFFLFRKLRSAASEAFKSMGQQYPEIQADINNIKNAFATLKASVGTAFQPLMAAAVPILNTITNLAVKAATAIGSLFAALTGQDYVYKATAANNDYSESVSGVGKAAKEANKQLGDYDELMVVQSSDDSDGGAGGGGGAGSGMNWEKVPVENSIKDLAARIKQAWKDADFFDIGEELGTKIKEKLDGIKWDKLKESAEKAGKSLATFLNGFFQSGVLASTGTTVSEALNTAIRGALGFVNNFDWGDNGVEFGKMFNNLVGYFDEHAFAELIANTIKGALDFVTGFFTEADFKELGKKIGSFISDLTMEIPEVTVKIAKLAWEIAKDAAGFVAGVNDSNPFLVDLMAMLGIMKLGAVPGLQIPMLVIAIAKIGWDLGHTIYDNLPKDAFGNNVIDKFVEATGLGELALNIADVFDDIAANGITGFWEGLKAGAKGIVDSIKKWVQDYIIDPWKEVLGIHSPSTVFAEFGKMCIEGLKNGITNAIASIKQWIQDNVVSKIQDAFDSLKDFAVTIKGKIDESFTKAKEAWNGLKDGAKDLLAQAKGNIEESFNSVKLAWDGFTEGTKELFVNAKATIEEKAQSLLNWFSNTGDTVKNFIANLTGPQKDTSFNNTISGLTAQFITWGKATSFGNTIGDMVASVVNWNKDTGKGKWSNTIGDMVAKFVDWSRDTGKGSKWSNTVGDMIAKFVDWKKDTGKGSKWSSIIGGMTAKFTKWKKDTGNGGKWSSVISGMTAKFTKWKNGIKPKDLVLSFTAKVTKVASDAASKIKNYFSKKADGGVYKNGKWFNIPQYASGGLPGFGSLFIAGEAGPEIVGNINGRTEVLNKSQIASAIHAAVIDGFMQVLNRLTGININLANFNNNAPIPVLVTGHALPSTDSFMFKFEEQHNDLEDIKAMIADVMDTIRNNNTTNSAPIVLQLQGKDIASVVWDETDKRYKQTRGYNPRRAY